MYRKIYKKNNKYSLYTRRNKVIEKNLGEIIFEVITEDYKDKVSKDKDLCDYLKEQTKHELLYLYLLYGYAANNEYIVEEIFELQRKKKEEIIKKIIGFLDTQIILILQFLNNKRMDDIKEIAYDNKLFKFVKNNENNVSLDTIKILKQLKFVFCKKEENGISIHMPKFIRDKINNISGNLYLDYYDDIISYSKGMANTYGAINIKNAYDIIKNDILIEFEKYDSIIKFTSLLELEPVYYSFEYQCIADFNIRDEEINEILEESTEKVIYDKETYQNIGNDNYLISIKEYKEFRNFLEEYYEFDINEDEILRGEIINDYIDTAQLNEKEAKDKLSKALDRYFEIDDFQKQEIISYIDKIRKKMPVWKQGGKIEKEIKLKKIGRNEPCPCGSGKKYKNCCGRDS